MSNKVSAVIERILFFFNQEELSMFAQRNRTNIGAGSISKSLSYSRLRSNVK